MFLKAISRWRWAQWWIWGMFDEFRLAAFVICWLQRFLCPLQHAAIHHISLIEYLISKNNTCLSFVWEQILELVYRRYRSIVMFFYRLNAGVSAHMVNQDQFYTIPDLTDEQRLDPRTSNSNSFASTISLNGPQAATAHVKRTSLHVWH